MNNNKRYSWTLTFELAFITRSGGWGTSGRVHYFHFTPGGVPSSREAACVCVGGSFCNGADRVAGERIYTVYGPRRRSSFYSAAVADRSHMPSMPMPCN